MSENLKTVSVDFENNPLKTDVSFPLRAVDIFIVKFTQKLLLEKIPITGVNVF